MTEKLLKIFIILFLHFKSAYSIIPHNVTNRQKDDKNKTLLDFKEPSDVKDKSGVNLTISASPKNYKSFFRNNNVDVGNGRNNNEAARSPVEWDVISFLTGGFMNRFLGETTEKPMKKKSNRTNNAYKDPDDDDPIALFLDKLDNTLRGIFMGKPHKSNAHPVKKRPNKTTVNRPNRVKGGSKPATSANSVQNLPGSSLLSAAQPGGSLMTFAVPPGVNFMQMQPSGNFVSPGVLSNGNWISTGVQPILTSVAQASLSGIPSVTGLPDESVMTPGFQTQPTGSTLQGDMRPAGASVISSVQISEQPVSNVAEQSAPLQTNSNLNQQNANVPNANAGQGVQYLGWQPSGNGVNYYQQYYGNGMYGASQHTGANAYLPTYSYPAVQNLNFMNPSASAINQFNPRPNYTDNQPSASSNVAAPPSAVLNENSGAEQPSASANYNSQQNESENNNNTDQPSLPGRLQTLLLVQDYQDYDVKTGTNSNRRKDNPAVEKNTEATTKSSIRAPIVKKVAKKPNIPVKYNVNQPFWPSTLSYSQFMALTTTPRSVKTPETSRRPWSLEMMKPSKMTQRPTTKQASISSIDCLNKKPPNSWMPQLFGTDVEDDKDDDDILETTDSPGWFDFLSPSDDDPEDEAENQVEESTDDGWFGGLLGDSSSSSPSSVASQQSSWFDGFLPADEDNGVHNISDYNPKKGRRRSYKSHQLLRVRVADEDQLSSLEDLKSETKGEGVVWWVSPPALHSSTTTADLLAPPELLTDIKDYLRSEDMKFEVLVWDMQKAISYENPRLSDKQRNELERMHGHPLTWQHYHRYADILRYMHYLALQHPNMVELLPLGRSSEGLPIIAVKVSLGGSRPTAGYGNKLKLKSRMKPAVWIDGGMHASEWITAAVATWFLQALIEGEYGTGPDMEMLKRADWYILPVANPDGYEYSHTRDRLWSKTRSRHTAADSSYSSWMWWNWGEESGAECVGVDAGRNWDYGWSAGGSNKKCSNNYRGPRPFSEPETMAVSRFIMDNKEQIKVYLTMHSSSRKWMMATSPSRASFADQADLTEMGQLALKALASGATSKRNMPTLTKSPRGSLSAHDWAKGRAGIKYSYAMQLQDLCGAPLAPSGLLVPASRIAPTARQTWSAVRTIVDNL